MDKRPSCSLAFHEREGERLFKTFTLSTATGSSLKKGPRVADSLFLKATFVRIESGTTESYLATNFHLRCAVRVLAQLFHPCERNSARIHARGRVKRGRVFWDFLRNF